MLASRPAWSIRLPCLSRSQIPRRAERGPSRPEIRPRVGSEAHQQVWGQPRQGDDCWGVGGWRFCFATRSCLERDDWNGVVQKCKNSFPQLRLFVLAVDWFFYIDVTKIIAASPWVPTQPFHDDPITVRHYRDFAGLVGCSGETVFDCLVSKDSLTLQYAANVVSTSAPTPHGNW